MENKYYHPKIEEFCVGLEFEEFDGVNGWKKRSIDCDEISSFFHFANSYPELLRVKHLDREDIESENWEFVAEANNNSFFYKKQINGKIYRLHHCVNLKGVSIFICDDDGMIFSQNKRVGLSIFSGTILNKSRLKLVMEMLNIEKK